MAKKNNTAEKTILDAEKITKALKEGTEKQLQSILNETVSNIIKENEEDIEDVEDTVEVVADDSYEVEDVDTENSTEEDETLDAEEGEEESQEEVQDDDTDEWSDFEEFKVGDNDYDFTGVDGETALKVYNKLNDDDEIFVTKDEDGNFEFKDEETGAEYVIELDTDGEEDAIADDEVVDNEDDEELDVEIVDDEDENNEELDVNLDDMDSEDSEELDIEIVDDEDDEDEEMISEDLGYTDSYQKDVFAKKPNMSEPSKGMNDWDKGAPKGAEKPWAGKGNMKPFGEDKQEIDENQTTSKSQRRKQVKTLAPNSGEKNKPEVSKETSIAGELTEAKIQKIINAAKAIQAENKQYKESINKIKQSLYEAAVLNVNLGKIVSLLVNETTTKEEKHNIIERFNNVKTIKEGNTLYESIKKELNGTTKKTAIMERQISMTPSKLNETTIFTQSNPSLEMMNRMDKLQTYYGSKK